MNNPLSPVEALQRRIIALHGLRDTASNIDGLVDDLIAALELAKADAEIKHHFPELGKDDVEVYPSKCGKCRAAFEKLEAARAKLYEALQK